MSIAAVSAYSALSPTRAVASRPESISQQREAVRALGNNQLLQSNGLGHSINASTESTKQAAYGRPSDYVSRNGNDSVRSNLSSYLQSTTVDATALGTKVDISA